MHYGNSNKLLIKRNDVDFSSISNSSQINWPMSREKRNIGNGGGEERRRNSLADYPIIRFSGTFAIYVSKSHPTLWRLPLLLPSLPRILVLVSTDRGNFRFHLAEVVRANMSRGSLIGNPHGSLCHS